MYIGTENSKRLHIALATAGLALVAAMASATDATTVVARQTQPTISQPYENSGIEIHSLERHVRFNDLDLSTSAGIAVLEKRVTASANAVCAQLGELFPKDYTTDEECRQQAVQSAMVQVRAAIAKAAVAKVAKPA
jgi:UrcA family protein